MLVVLIGGMDSDPTPAQIAGTAGRTEGNSGLFRLRADVADSSTGARILPEYFNWNGTRAGKLKSRDVPGSQAIAELIHRHLQDHPRDRVAVVGNSWGGHTALEVITALRHRETPVAVNLVVFLDASSAGRGGNKRILPENANRVVHYCTRNAFVWGRWTAGARLENIDLGDADAGFLQKGGPAYAAPFDFRAHVAAEWDERIHADIKRRLLELVVSEP